METKVWKLGGYVIWEDDKGIGWGAYMYEKPYPGDKPFEPFVGLFTGWAYIELDTLIMSSWKVHQESKNFKTWEEVERYLGSLPVWDRTTYWVKIADIGMSGLMSCKMMQEVPEKEADPIMLALGFTKVIEEDDNQYGGDVEAPLCF